MSEGLAEKVRAQVSKADTACNEPTGDYYGASDYFYEVRPTKLRSSLQIHVEPAEGHRHGRWKSLNLSRPPVLEK